MISIPAETPEDMRTGAFDVCVAATVTCGAWAVFPMEMLSDVSSVMPLPDGMAVIGGASSVNGKSLGSIDRVWRACVVVEARASEAAAA
ncbi:hypothetical protein GCM10011585_31740 [Edaphobacter dinghuensis]|uniref:Uncharacterized protein n=1 Tax=Edaphobacter dinghuensis TaxID=1560005 RepID=A0A917MAK7_9BACT|nr:hypothetical protein GCM10011585_31740 [Edaphobacter dinghuensis]